MYNNDNLRPIITGTKQHAHKLNEGIQQNMYLKKIFPDKQILKMQGNKITLMQLDGILLMAECLRNPAYNRIPSTK